MLLGRSDIKNAVANEPKVKADLLEAIFGAIAVESNWDSMILEAAVSKSLQIDETIEMMIESDPKVRCFDIDNAISTLKELAEQGQCTMPTYEFTGPEYIGYDSDGNPKWACSCAITNDKIGLTKRVFATSKKDAKKAAARSFSPSQRHTTRKAHFLCAFVITNAKRIALSRSFYFSFCLAVLQEVISITRKEVHLEDNALKSCSSIYLVL